MNPTAYTYEDKTAEIEGSFSYDGYQIVRREMFAHLREPAVVIRKESITFNTACINGLEDAVYIQILINHDQRRMVIRKCNPDDKDALRWCIAKPDKRKSRKISSKEFSRKIYKMMDWHDQCRYKILGHRISYDGEILYVFELDEIEIFYERKKQTKAEVISEDKQELTPEQLKERQKEERKMTMKPFYPDDWENSFGIPVDRHKNVSIETLDGFGSYDDLKVKQQE